MKKEKELIDSLIKLHRVANEQGIIIKEIGLRGFWYSTPTEVAPDKLLGMNIK
jgi:hypothetical protein